MEQRSREPDGWPLGLVLHDPRGPIVQGLAAYPAATEHPLKRKLVWVARKSKIGFAEGKFCRNNEGRCGGLQYCREIQGAVA